jgi:hypothetical protein
MYLDDLKDQKLKNYLKDFLKVYVSHYDLFTTASSDKEVKRSLEKLKPIEDKLVKYLNSKWRIK